MKLPARRRRLLGRPRRAERGIPLRAILPNAITASALCVGLTAIRFALNGDWETAVLMVLIAGFLDGIDGGIARLVGVESRFGAELDSLSDAISFGVAPALILFLWSLHDLPRAGWLVALVYALFCALRLARFNAGIDRAHQPHKAAGFMIGVPAPAGALLAMTPLYIWFFTGEPFFRSLWLVAPWTALVALLMVSSLATWSSKSLRLRQRVRFEAIALLVVLTAALLTAPWPTLTVIALLYLGTIPLSVRSYRRVRPQPEAAGEPTSVSASGASAPGEPAP